MKYDSIELSDHLVYDIRPEADYFNDAKPADAMPTEAAVVDSEKSVLKPWILPTGNCFIKDESNRHERPDGYPGAEFPLVQNDFDDSNWETVNLPHDWAIKGPFMEGENPVVGGGMGRLPSPGVAWYRRDIQIGVEDQEKAIFLDIDGAMSYAMVWINGKLAGGWPYGYNSFRIDLTPYLNYGGDNQLAIRLDNPNHSSRWYPGGGLYRNVWLVKTQPVHVGQWGTFITTSEVSDEAAKIDFALTLDNQSNKEVFIVARTEIFERMDSGKKSTSPVGAFEPVMVKIPANGTEQIASSTKLIQPKLWGPPPTQVPNMYVAVTEITNEGIVIDRYETSFGIRSLEFDPNQGVLVNGELVKIKGVNQHHDLGALGAAFNVRAAERQLEVLREMGCNAIRMAHNPPAPELLELTDKMGFMVIDEVFDSWERKKTPHDFHLIFSEWFEQDLRSMIRRDRNHPSIFMWSYGNEVGEQYMDEAGAEIARQLVAIVKDEDTSRPTICAMNWAKPDMPFSEVMDVIGLNYQGEGIRQEPEFQGTNRIRTPPMYDAFHEAFPDKVILSTETASAFSSRGVYLFPVSNEFSAPARDGRGGDSKIRQTSAYELHAVDFGSTAQKVFRTIDQHPFVAGEFVWTGWDYLGEPTPYYSSRSSYNGIIDLAGFKKDRFYQYQAHWRPDYPMVHILPHWTWPERVGKVTPVHVFTSGDEVELFLNGESLGRKSMSTYEYRIRWDDVIYEPGELKAVAYKGGQKWAEEIVKSAGVAVGIRLSVDRASIKGDGQDLAFVTAEIVDANGWLVPRADHLISFSLEGPGQIIATDNGDPTDMTSFSSIDRRAFSGKALAIIRSLEGVGGNLIVSAKSSGLMGADLTIETK